MVPCWRQDGLQEALFSHLFQTFLEVLRQTPKKPTELSQNAFKLIQEWCKMVRNLVQKRKTLNTCWAERSEARPPLPKDPPKHIPWKTVTQTNMQTCTKICTEIHVHRHKRTDKRTHRGRKTKLRSSEQNESSILGIGISSPKQVFYMFDVPMLR